MISLLFIFWLKCAAAAAPVICLFVHNCPSFFVFSVCKDGAFNLRLQVVALLASVTLS